jgi:hypothetical protein
MPKGIGCKVGQLNYRSFPDVLEHSTTERLFDVNIGLSKIAKAKFERGSAESH